MERGHAVLLRILARLTEGSGLPWVNFLEQALWADRIAPRASTGHSPFFLLYGRDARMLSQRSDPYISTVPSDGAAFPQALALARADATDRL